MKKKAKFTTMQIYLLVGLVPVICTTIISCLLSVVTIRNNLVEQTKSRLTVACADANRYFGIDWDEWMLEGEVTEDDEQYVDLHKGENIEVTIFQGDTRYLSSIRDEQGNRISGTKANEDVIETVLKNGEDYFSTNTKINGKDYYAYYKPIYSGNNIVGMAFAGETTEKVNASLEQTLRTLMIASVVLTLIFIGIVVCIAWNVKKPIISAAKGMKQLADGNISLAIDAKSIIKETAAMLDSEMLYKMR